MYLLTKPNEIAFVNYTTVFHNEFDKAHFHALRHIVQEAYKSQSLGRVRIYELKTGKETNLAILWPNLLFGAKSWATSQARTMGKPGVLSKTFGFIKQTIDGRLMFRDPTGKVAVGDEFENAVASRLLDLCCEEQVLPEVMEFICGLEGPARQIADEFLAENAIFKHCFSCRSYRFWSDSRVIGDVRRYTCKTCGRQTHYLFS